MEEPLCAVSDEAKGSVSQSETPIDDVLMPTHHLSEAPIELTDQ